MNMNISNGAFCEKGSPIFGKYSFVRSSNSLIKDCDTDSSSFRMNSGLRTTDFSLKDICPEDSFEKRPKHHRMTSEQVNLLKPQYLFSVHTLKQLKNPRKSLTLKTLKPLTLKKKPSLADIETITSTRSNTSHSKKLNDQEFLKFLSHIPKINKNSESNFCKFCEKYVPTNLRFPDEGDFEHKLVEFFNYFIACWEPLWTKKYQVLVCEECGKSI